MIRSEYSGSLLFLQRLSITVLFLAVLPKYVLAGCNWGTGADLGVQGGISDTDVTFELATFKMMSFKFWSNDGRFPVGSLMGLYNFTLTGRTCTGLGELKDSRLDVVYAPPAGAIPYGAGFMTPSSAEGVAMLVEFPSGSPHPGGIYLGSTVSKVSYGGILLPNGGLPSIPIRLSLIKTGSFTAVPFSLVGAIDFPNGIGWLKYYSTNNPQIVAAFGNRLRMDRTLTPGTDRGLAATVYAPLCRLFRLGGVSLDEALASSESSIKLGPVSTGDFSAIGALDNASQVRNLTFDCNGTTSTKASISFDATFPHNAGVNGVGMAEANADVGVQILLNDVPVKFGQYSSPLPWHRKTYKQNGWKISNWYYGTLDPQGLYCVNDCGDDMNNANWHDGGAGYGDNVGIETPVTFKYYQTTSKTPQPQAFSVPFTITLNVE